MENSNLSQIQIEQLKEKLEEIKKERNEFKEQYEWVQTRLKEQEALITNFRATNPILEMANSQ